MKARWYWLLLLYDGLFPWAGQMTQIASFDCLATRAGKMELSCPFGTTRLVPRQNLLRKLSNFRSRWLDIDLVLFCEFMELDSASVHKYTKKTLAYIQPFLTSRLVNNPYLPFSLLSCWLISSLEWRMFFFILFSAQMSPLYRNV